MEESTVKIHVVQISPATRDVVTNVITAIQIIEECSADLVLLPELFLSGYQLQNLGEVALTPSSPQIDQLREVCRRTKVALVAGFIEQGQHGEFYNSLLVIDWDGAQRGPVRKTHLFGAERTVFTPGQRLEPSELCNHRWGIINCFELEFPEVARTLALQGAEGFLMVSANMRPYEDDHVFAVRVRSKENRLPSAYSNRVGYESGHEFCGLSMVVDQDGNVLHAMDEVSQLRATIPVSLSSETRQAVDMLSQRRPELYM